MFIALAYVKHRSIENILFMSTIAQYMFQVGTSSLNLVFACKSPSRYKGNIVWITQLLLLGIRILTNQKGKVT